jgi:hypothetical protein
MATIRQGLETNHVVAQAAKEKYNIETRRGQDVWVKPGGAQTLRTTMVALGLCTLRKLFTIFHACDLDHQALGCAYSDETRLVLEQNMLWNGQHSCRALSRYQVNPSHSRRWCTHMLGTTRTRTHGVCLPGIPPAGPISEKLKLGVQGRQENASG